jgi:hypothetical protein
VAQNQHADAAAACRLSGAKRFCPKADINDRRGLNSVLYQVERVPILSLGLADIESVDLFVRAIHAALRNLQLEAGSKNHRSEMPWLKFRRESQAGIYRSIELQISKQTY